MNYTSIEQSKRLLELGLKPETSDMVWSYNVEDGKYYPNITPYSSWKVPNWGNKNHILPCWSTEALIDLLPEVVYGPYPPDHPTKLLIYKHNSKKVVFYFDETGMQHGEEFLSDSLIDSCYAAVLWLIENGYIKKGE